MTEENNSPFIDENYKHTEGGADDTPPEGDQTPPAGNPDTKSKAEQYFDRVNELVGEGNTKTKAYELCAAEFDVTPSSVRNGYYQHTRKANGGGGELPKVSDDPIKAALAGLQKALAQIDTDVERMRDRAQAAQETYEELRDTSEDRKANLQKRIEALQALDTEEREARENAEEAERERLADEERIAQEKAAEEKVKAAEIEAAGHVTVKDPAKKPAAKKAPAKKPAAS